MTVSCRVNFLATFLGGITILCQYFAGILTIASALLAILLVLQTTTGSFGWGHKYEVAARRTELLICREGRNHCADPDFEFIYHRRIVNAIFLTNTVQVQCAPGFAAGNANGGLQGFTRAIDDTAND